MVRNDRRFQIFLENARIIRETYGITPLPYGPMAIAYQTGQPLDPAENEIDILLPAKIFIILKLKFRETLSRFGFEVDDPNTHVYIKDGIRLNYAPIEELWKITHFYSHDVKKVTEGTCTFMLLSFEQAIEAYSAAPKNVYREHVFYRHAEEFIPLLREHIRRRDARAAGEFIPLYGKERAESMTLYRCDTPPSPGVMLVCPGGAYRIKAEHEGAPIAEMLSGAGIDAAVLDYRVAPCSPGDPLEDAHRAIRLLRSMGYQKVGILGFSAGGNLACCAAMHGGEGDAAAEDPVERLSSRTDALVSCYSVVSMTEHTHVGSLMNLLGEQHGSISLQRFFSAERWVTKDAPPAFIWHTAADSAVPAENSLSLAASYSRAGIPFELHIFPEGEHGLGLAEGYAAEAWAPLCRDWLRRQGFAKE